MRVPWRRLTWLLVAAIPIAVVAGIVWGATRDLSRYQARLTEQIRKVTGRELAARVPLTVKLGSEPAMVAEGVTLSNAAWGSRPDMARVRKLTLVPRSGRALPGGGQDRPYPARGRRHPGRAERRGRHQPRNVAATRRIGSSPRGASLAQAAHGHGVSLDQHRRGARLGPDHRRGRRPSASGAGNSHRHLPLGSAQPAVADRGPLCRAPGHAVRAHRDHRLVRRLDEKPAW